MSLRLLTQPAFLRKNFPYTREGLLGQWPGLIDAAISEPVELESVMQEALPEIETVPVSTPEIFPRLPETPKTVAYQVESTQPAVEVFTAAVPKAPLSPKPQEEIFEVEKSTSQTWNAPKVAVWKPIAKFVLSVTMIISLITAAIIIVPEVYFRTFSTNNSVSEVANQAKIVADHQPVITPEPQPYMPAFNPDLPTGMWLSIPRIGVYSELHPTINPNEALDKGVWLVPDFGRPGDTTQPTIVAAHRYGWDWWWQTDYWKYNSFYLLTETQPGDRVEIIYDQRKWVYEIYAGEEGEIITDYDADLILYTCKYLNSPIRYFRYAKVVEE